MRMTMLVAATMGAGLAMAIGTPARAQDAVAGKAMFKSQCRTFHSLSAGKNLVGPSLYGVYRQKSGQVAGFHFTDANKNSGLVWDTPTLDRYLTSPRDVIPKTIMTYGGLKDTTKRTDLIAYLASLH